MNEKFIKDMIRMVKLKCQVCGQCFSEDDIEIIRKKDGSCYLNIYCPVCNQRSFAVALFKQEDLQIEDHIDEQIERQSIQTDNMNSISASDVTDIHTFLDSFNGDFGTLFNHDD